MQERVFKTDTWAWKRRLMDVQGCHLLFIKLSSFHFPS